MTGHIHGGSSSSHLGGGDDLHFTQDDGQSLGVGAGRNYTKLTHAPGSHVAPMLSKSYGQMQARISHPSDNGIIISCNPIGSASQSIQAVSGRISSRAKIFFRKDIGGDLVSTRMTSQELASMKRIVDTKTSIQEQLVSMGAISSTKEISFKDLVHLLGELSKNPQILQHPQFQSIIDDFDALVGETSETFDVLTSDSEDLMGAFEQMDLLEAELEQEGINIHQYTERSTIAGLGVSREDIMVIHDAMSRIATMKQSPDLSDLKYDETANITVQIKDLKQARKRYLIGERKAKTPEERARYTRGLAEINGAISSLEGKIARMGGAAQFSNIGNAYQAFCAQNGSPDILDQFSLSSQDHIDLQKLMDEAGKLAVVLGLGAGAGLDVIQNACQNITLDPKADPALQARASQFLQLLDDIQQQFDAQNLHSGAQVNLKTIQAYYNVAKALNPGLLQGKSSSMRPALANHSWQVVSAAIATYGLNAVLAGKCNQQMDELQRSYDVACKNNTVDAWNAQNKLAHPSAPDTASSTTKKDGVSGDIRLSSVDSENIEVMPSDIPEKAMASKIEASASSETDLNQDIAPEDINRKVDGFEKEIIQNEVQVSENFREIVENAKKSPIVETVMRSLMDRVAELKTLVDDSKRLSADERPLSINTNIERHLEPFKRDIQEARESTSKLTENVVAAGNYVKASMGNLNREYESIKSQRLELQKNILKSSPKTNSPEASSIKQIRATENQLQSKKIELNRLTKRLENLKAQQKQLEQEYENTLIELEAFKQRQSEEQYALQNPQRSERLSQEAVALTGGAIERDGKAFVQEASASFRSSSQKYANDRVPESEERGERGDQESSQHNQEQEG